VHSKHEGSNCCQDLAPRPECKNCVLACTDADVSYSRVSDAQRPLSSFKACRSCMRLTHAFYATLYTAAGRLTIWAHTHDGMHSRLLVCILQCRQLGCSYLLILEDEVEGSLGNELTHSVLALVASPTLVVNFDLQDQDTRLSRQHFTCQQQSLTHQDRDSANKRQAVLNA